MAKQVAISDDVGGGKNVDMGLDSASLARELDSLDCLIASGKLEGLHGLMASTINPISSYYRARNSKLLSDLIVRSCILIRYQDEFQELGINVDVFRKRQLHLKLHYQNVGSETCELEATVHNFILFNRTFQDHMTMVEILKKPGIHLVWDWDIISQVEEISLLLDMNKFEVLVNSINGTSLMASNRDHLYEILETFYLPKYIIGYKATYIIIATTIPVLIKLCRYITTSRRKLKLHWRSYVGHPTNGFRSFVMLSTFGCILIIVILSLFHGKYRPSIRIYSTMMIVLYLTQIVTMTLLCF